MLSSCSSTEKNQPAYSGKVRTIPWSEAGEAAALLQMDIGIMPLPDNPWERGKCAYKLIQYMACGLPVVASPRGNEYRSGGTGYQWVSGTNRNRMDRSPWTTDRRLDPEKSLWRKGPSTGYGKLYPATAIQKKWKLW